MIGSDPVAAPRRSRAMSNVVVPVVADAVPSRRARTRRAEVRTPVVTGASRLGRLRRAAGPLVGIAAAGLVVVAVQPAMLARALGRASLPLIGCAALASLLYTVLQGVRWQPLLRDAGVHVSALRTVVLTVAGRATCLLPCGELTRAVLLCQAQRVEPGTVVGSLTVQELLYMGVLIAVAVPGSLAMHVSAIGVGTVVAGFCGVLLILASDGVYGAVRCLLTRHRLTSGLALHVDDLQHSASTLLRSPRTLTWMPLTALSAATAITMFWLAAQAVAPGAIGWRQCAFVYTVSHMAGAASLIPGGIGAFDVSVVALLSAMGIAPGEASAVAIIAHAADKAVSTAVGATTFAIARRPLGLPASALLRFVPSGESRARAKNSDLRLEPATAAAWAGLAAKAA
jgi:uncharacterized membrane protein YbhN (UPF0104 family)